MAKSIEGLYLVHLLHSDWFVDYTHRIGRTGRAGEKGTAITFLSNGDEATFFDLKQMLLKSPVSKCPNELMRHEAAQTRQSSNAHKKKYEDTNANDDQ